MATETERVVDSSALVKLAYAVASRVRTWVASDTDVFEAATDASALAGVLRAVACWIRHSFLYRWLTREPDPDVVVIDLRDTYTLGPVVALLDRVRPSLERTWRASLTYRVTARLEAASKREWITNSRTVRLVVAALEPPERPDGNPR